MFIWTAAAEPDSPRSDGLADFKSAIVSKSFLAGYYVITLYSGVVEPLEPLFFLFLLQQ